MTDMNIEDEKQLVPSTMGNRNPWKPYSHREKHRPDGIDQMFFIWFSVNFNILAFGAGSSGPAFFALGIRIAYLRYLLWMSFFGPKLGMRAMVQCRFSWGYYAAAIPSTLNVFSSQSFLILNCIIGGQTLATVSHKLDDTLGIVIIGLISSVLLGFLLPMLAWNMIGAAFAAAAPGIPSWITGFQEGSNVGGLLAAVLAPAGGFGKLLLVLMQTPIFCHSNAFMAITPLFAQVPRYVFTVVSTAILIPLAIIGVGHFYTVLVNILSVIGYWSTIFAAIILTEHFLFCKNNFNSYQIQDWDKPSKLPIGIAALLSFLGGFGIVIPSMSQIWYIGPIAKAGTGDIGVLTGAVVGAALYMILRTLEKRIFLGR
ncbi:hypothetical protein BYT27DRAFT_7213747 [Phlegmacium glaucopus]|nr:hypothetical protein BYT27DRAFT_7213747 [Phlegmacium glaucopus]